MNGTLSKILWFTTGAAIGSVVTWKFVKVKYERIAQEEIDSVKDVYSERYANEDSTEQIAEDDELNFRDYVATLAENEYTDYANMGVSDDKEVDGVNAPYVISPEEYGEIPDYETISLFYYSDDVLTDDQDRPVDDADDIVGLDSLTHFGEYEDDSVHVRNDERKTDYEILLDPRNYSDVINKRPHRAER